MAAEILLAIRVGPSSVVPARAALKLARQIDAHVTVLYVAGALHPVDLVGSDGLTLEDEQNRILQDAETELQEFMAEHLSGVEATSRLASGPVAEQVAAVAAEIEADYIVVGTRGRSALARLVLGDTTQSILQHSTRPVVVVPIQPDTGS